MCTHACLRAQNHTFLPDVHKSKRWSIIGCYYHFDYLRSETLYWVIQLKGQNCPLKIRSFGLSFFLLSLHPRSAFISFSFFNFSLLFFVPSFTFSLCYSRTLFPFLSCLGRHECGRQMAGMFHVSEGSCLSHSPSSLPARRSVRWAEE